MSSGLTGGSTTLNNSAGGETKSEGNANRGIPPTTAFPYDGSTATVVLVVGNKVYVANCGDSAGKRWMNPLL